jgi:hypothetical protein
VLEVNLREEYHKRKGNSGSSKPKPAKKTISIAPEEAKAGDSVLSLRKASYSAKEQKVEIKLRERESTAKRHGPQEDIDLSLMSVNDLSSCFTPLSSVHSFMRSSRHSEANSFADDTLRNTFTEFSVLAAEDCVYHLGGLSDTYTEKYHPDTGNSERVAATHAQFKGRGFTAVRLSTQKEEKCLLVGTASSGKALTVEVFEFGLREERITRSCLKVGCPKSSFGCLAKDSRLFLIGGKSHEKALSSVESYRVEGSELVFAKMGSLVQARFDHACCLGFDGHLYVLGGIGLCNDALSSVERCNLERSDWETLPPMRQPRINFAAVATPRGLFVIGGHTTKRFLKEVEFYDYEEGRWAEKAPLLHSRCYHSAVLSKDYSNITVFGGLSDDNAVLDSVEVYDILDNEWTAGGRMREKRCLHVSVQK